MSVLKKSIIEILIEWGVSEDSLVITKKGPLIKRFYIPMPLALEGTAWKMFVLSQFPTVRRSDRW